MLMATEIPEYVESQLDCVSKAEVCYTQKYSQYLYLSNLISHALVSEIAVDVSFVAGKIQS